MPSWSRRRSKSQDSSVAEALIRVCVVGRDSSLVKEVHEDLMVGFSTRGGYDFEAGHPDFQEFCDVLFVDLRAAGLRTGEAPQAHASEARANLGTIEESAGAKDSSSATDPDAARLGAEQEGLAFIDAIRASVSHPPIVVLCDADAAEFSREVVRRGAYDRLNAPLNGPQLRLALQRAYEFRLAEIKLETFLTAQTVAKERPRKVRSRVRPSAPPVAAVAAPSRLAVGFVLGCVLFFAGLVAVRTILSGMGDALASAGFAADSGSGAAGANGAAPGTRSGGFAARQIWPLTDTADFNRGSLNTDSARHPFGPDGGLAARPHSAPSGYDPAELIERVTPRYSVEARSRHLQGTVQIRALIGPDGVPHGLARLSGDPTLAQIAIDAIALWRYAPATLDGSPVESEVIIPLDFQLSD